MSELVNIISGLIHSQKEGLFWDFKQEHHTNSADLVHDIICLANVSHEGDRYLIYGVSDAFQLIGCQTHKKQADIIDMLRSSSFADGIFPDIALESVCIDNKQLDVLIVRAIANKPYYLTEPKTNADKSKSVRAHHIYTRTMDTNTPLNQSANSKQIEQMWKERFGLTQTPLEKFKIYLSDADNWSQDDTYKYHYKYHPEFTFQEADTFGEQGCETREWARGQIGYSYTDGRNQTRCYEFYYFGTKLFKCVYCYFDGGKKRMVNPDWEPIGNGRIYYYLEDGLEYSFHKFMSNTESDDSKGLSKVLSALTFDIPVFMSKTQLNSFIRFSKAKLKINDSHSFQPQSEEQQNILFYELLNIYNEFINKEEI